MYYKHYRMTKFKRRLKAKSKPNNNKQVVTLVRHPPRINHRANQSNNQAVCIKVAAVSTHNNKAGIRTIINIMTMVMGIVMGATVIGGHTVGEGEDIPNILNRIKDLKSMGNQVRPILVKEISR